MLQKWSITIMFFFLAALCITFAGDIQPAGASSSYSIELDAAQEFGLGGTYNNYWDLQKNISVVHGSGEFFQIFGGLSQRIIYRGGEGCGFMEAGNLPKPAGQEVLQFTPEILAYNGTQYISADRLYILKTQSLGYFALYVDDIKVIKEEPYLNFTLYKLKGAPAKASSVQPVPTTNPTTIPVSPEVSTPEVSDNSGTQRTTLSFPDGAVYAGEAKEGKPEGAGKMTWPDGAEYTGEFESGQPDGEGTKTYASGEKYIGEWKNGLKDGQGTYIWYDNERYDGEWKNGEINGQGTLTKADGTVTEGLWKDSVFMGDGSVDSQPSGTTSPSNTENAGLTKISFDQKPIVVNGRTFVPLRNLFEALGAKVKWDDPTQTIIATKDANTVQLQIDNTAAWFNGEARQLEAAPFISDEKTFVPLRFASEALGEEVTYESNTGLVVFGDYYFYLDEGGNSGTSGQQNSDSKQEGSIDNPSGQEDVVEESGNTEDSSQTGNSEEDSEKAFWNEFNNRNYNNSYYYNSRPWTNVRPYAPY